MIELLVSLSLFCIILFFSIPYTQSFYNKNRLQVVADDITTAINSAKVQALLTGDTLALTRIPGSNNWSDGMLLFVDNGSHLYTPNLRLLHEWHWKSGSVQIVWKGFQSTDYLLFSSDFRQNATNGHFEINSPSYQKISLVVNRFGRVRASSS